METQLDLFTKPETAVEASETAIVNQGLRLSSTLRTLSEKPVQAARKLLKDITKAVQLQLPLTCNSLVTVKTRVAGIWKTLEVEVPGRVAMKGSAYVTGWVKGWVDTGVKLGVIA
ncbi:hypothetical protein ACWJJH_14185 [Endozoicomonadaceae bacterium StTr2]